MFKLIKQAEVYSPDELGVCDILISGGKIIQVEKDIDQPTGFECEVIDASGLIAYPGFIDGHVHLTGADDGQGPVGRTFDISWQDIVESGTTTLVGCLGGSIWVRNLFQLYLKTLELEKMGLTTYMYTGCFHIPPPTLTGEIRKDVFLIPKVKGLKTAISDSTSSHRTWRDLAEIASEVAIGASIVKKRAVTHVHVGRNPARMDTLFELYERTRLPPDMIIPTHVNRLHPDVIAQGIDYAKLGGIVDLSTLMRKEEGTMTGLKTEYAVKRMLDEGAPIENITISSDGNVPMAMRDEDMNQIGLYVAPLDFNRREIRDIVNNGVAPLSEALKMVTTNVARVLGIEKGRIKKGYDADIVIAESIDSLKVKEVYAKGTRMVKNGKTIFQGHYQEDPYKHMYN